MADTSLDTLYAAIMYAKTTGVVGQGLTEIAALHPNPHMTAEMLTLVEHCGANISPDATGTLQRLSQEHKKTGRYCSFVSALFSLGRRHEQVAEVAKCTPRCIERNLLLHARAALLLAPRTSQDSLSELLIVLNECLRKNDLIRAPQLLTFVHELGQIEQKKVPAFQRFLQQASLQMKCYQNLKLSPQLLWEITLMNSRA